MSMLSRQYAAEAPATNAAGTLGRFHQPTLGERLRERQASLTAELQIVNEAIDKLEANPVIEEVLNFVSKVGF